MGQFSVNKSLLRVQVRQFYKYAVNRVSRELRENDLLQSAIVFSPHPDDETLGCGGTIIRKKRLGVDVKIVFMTDGSRSHPHLISKTELKSIRSREALAATRMLGVEESNVVFLEFEDGNLWKNQDSAMHKVIKILRCQQPNEIFIPYYKELPIGSKDHFTTNRIVLSALQKYRQKAIIYEYPIWFWWQWPWVSLPISRRRQILRVLKNGFVSGLSLLRDFTCCVYIRDVLELKRAALNQHKSQMTRIIPDPRWVTLGSLSSGEFLECFFQDHEVFHRYSFLGKC